MKPLATLWVVVVVLVSWILWDSLQPTTPVNALVPAEVAPQVAKVEKVTITPSSVKVYKPKAKVKLSLPPEIKDNAAKHVLEATLVRSDTHDRTVITLIDEVTGETQTLVRKEPLPWLRLKQSGEVRVDYGVTNGGDRLGRLTVHQDLIQVKRIHAGVTASLDTDGRVFAGGGVAWRW